TVAPSSSSKLTGIAVQ
ncbi:colicin release lysis protein, partial [Pseudomonas aeruginosa]|nr:colicin release lysis protein [Pseudomonas aeruginosa]